MLDGIKLKLKRSRFYPLYQKSGVPKLVLKSRKIYNKTKSSFNNYSYLYCRKPARLRKWKGQIYFITFGSERFKSHLQRIYKEANNSGFFDSITILSENDLPEDYKKQYSINESTRGFGYWIWKSYITKKKLEEIAMGDILVYLDSGCSINKQGKKRYFEYLKLLLESKHSNLSFQTNFPEKKYTKEDLFLYFGLDKNEAIKNSGQLSCCPFLIKKDDNSIKLVDEWFTICHNKKRLIDDSLSIHPNDPQFIEHRHDQSVFSLLRKTKGTVIIKDEIKFNNWKENLHFPFHIHRFK